MSERLEVRAVSRDWHSSVAIMMRVKHDNGRVSVAKNIEFVEQDRSFPVGDLIDIPISSAQVLMDDLWNAGIRPTEGSGSAGSLKATENHLNDMRKIVAKQLDISI